MAKQTVETLIEGGKATAAPPLGPALGPTGVNIGQVVAEINKKTAYLKCIQVPVKVIVDTEEKTFTIEIGTPPAAALIKKEAGIKKGSGNPLTDKVADLLIEQVIKVAKAKSDALLGSDLKAKVREIVGTCQSMGVLVEGMPAPDALKAIAEGKFDEKISSGKTEITAEEQAKLDVEKAKMQEELAEKKAAYLVQAKQLVDKFKDVKKARKAMVEEGIPQVVIDEVAPAEDKGK